MPATNFFEDDLLDLIFTNVNAPNIGDAPGLRGSVTDGSFYISLHTGSSISDTSTLQTDSEALYSGYARVAVARTTGGFTVTSGAVTNDAAITFPVSTNGPETETDFGIGYEASAAGNLQIYGALTSPLIVNNGITPEFAISALSISVE